MLLMQFLLISNEYFKFTTGPRTYVCAVVLTRISELTPLSWNLHLDEILTTQVGCTTIYQCQSWMNIICTNVNRAHALKPARGI